MLKHILTLVMAAILAGGLFTSDAQARGGGFGGHIGGMHIRGGLGEPHMGNHFDGIRMSGLGDETHSHRHHFGDGFCDEGGSDCGLYGCRYLWESQIHCY
jgi:hypothetical protein